MNVLLVGNFLSSQGRTRSVCEDLSEQLTGTGHTVIQTSSKVGRVSRLLDIISTIAKRRQDYQLAYVEVFSGPAFVLAEMAGILLSLFHKPTVLALHGGGLAEFAKRNPARIEMLLRRAQKVVTPSLFLQASLGPYCSVIGYLPNGVHVDRYPFQARCNPEPRLVWLRAFHEIYQPDLAVRAIADLAVDFDNISLTMIGPDKKDGSLLSSSWLAERLGIGSRVEIVGPIPKADVPTWLAKSDVFLNTTRLESFGVSVLEAALVGLPIVTTDAGELPLLWEDERTAMLVPTNDPAAMAAAVKRILIEPHLAERLSYSARKKAEQFDWSLILPLWEDLFAEVLRA